MENPFEDFLTSEIRVIKPDGSLLGPLKANVQENEISIFDVQYPVTAGDKIVRDLPNGITETYAVENAEYLEAFFDMPASYRLHVAKEDDRTRTKTLSATNIFNVHGDFSRVNFQSQDRSVNVQHRTETVFYTARQALRDGIKEQDLLNELLSRLQAIEEAKSQPKWAAAYGKFIESAANHMAIIAPFLPALAQTVSHLT